MHVSNAVLKVQLKANVGCIIITNGPIEIKATLRCTVTARGITGHAKESK